MSQPDELFGIPIIFAAYAALFSMAVVPIYIGSRNSVKFEAKKKGEEEEFFSLDDAKWFPFVGSATLFGLYLVFKYLDKEIVNYIVTAYFALLGVGAGTNVLLDVYR